MNRQQSNSSFFATPNLSNASESSLCHPAFVTLDFKRQGPLINFFIFSFVTLFRHVLTAPFPTFCPNTPENPL